MVRLFLAGSAVLTCRFRARLGDRQALLAQAASRLRGVSELRVCSLLTVRPRNTHVQDCCVVRTQPSITQRHAIFGGLLSAYFVGRDHLQFLKEYDVGLLQPRKVDCLQRKHSGAVQNSPIRAEM